MDTIWEEMKTGVDEENESDGDNGSPPSPEDWHSQVPSVSLLEKVSSSSSCIYLFSKHYSLKHYNTYTVFRLFRLQ